MDFNNIIKQVTNKKELFLSGLWGVSFAYFIYRAYDKTSRSFLIIFEDKKQAKLFYSDLILFLKEDDVILYPELDLASYEEITYRNIILRRLENYYRIFKKKQFVFITTLKNMMLKKDKNSVMPCSGICKNIIRIKKDDIIDFKDMEESFYWAGYIRVNKVMQTGEYAIRGDIIDIFPPNYSSPARIEFFNDTVEDLRFFNIENQRSSEKIDLVEIYPAEEVILNPKAVEHFEKNIDTLIRERTGQKGSDLWEGPAFSKDFFLNLKESVRKKEFFNETSIYAPLFYREAGSILESFDRDVLLFLPAQGSMVQSYNLIYEEITEFHKKRAAQNIYIPEAEQFLFLLKDIEKALKEHSMVFYQVMPFNVSGEIQFHVKGIPDFSGDAKRFHRFYKDRIDKDYKINFLSEYPEQLESIQVLLEKENIEKKLINFKQGALSRGFEIDIFNEIFIHDFEFFGRVRSSYSKTYKSRILSREVESIYDLEEGDFVVHVENGIGIYHGIKKVKTENKIRDFFNIEYANSMTLLLPLEKINLLHKYIGDDDNPPKLNRLGTEEFKKTKKKIEKSLITITKDLIRIYAIRNDVTGVEFPKDTDWQKKFESSFKYVETPDQIKVMQEIKQDLEKDKPMDRLLCGDVGYGKTEIAIRAAFKVNMSGKQVAVLVPTTILAQQHYNTFSERLADYPVRVEMLSRFLNKKQQKKIVKEVNEGKVDIIIGTHRLVSPDIRFKALGLAIIDEEQRFGVIHKEKLKILKSIVDVLTMSATPIPRTLYMSLSNIRDISLIETPPEGRVPVSTSVEKFSPEAIRRAILLELERGGQAFFVHNRIKSIYAMEDFLKKIVPEAKFLVAHGRMESDDLELAMLEFVDRNFDVMICTTIIESGIDMPNVNTIIINRADTFGLSQLYQLRGRVGRGLHKGYALLLYPGSRAITETAQKRLLTISEYSQLGSGYKIALRDMEIRGAGNIFGPQQHVNIIAVGLELYSRILENAVKSFKHEDTEEWEVDLEFEYDAFIPDTYLNDNRIKIELYKSLNKCREFDEVKLFVDELADRFSPRIPAQMKNLFLIQDIKIICRKAGILLIKKSETKIYEFVLRMEFLELSKNIRKKVEKIFSTGKIRKNTAYINIEKEDFLKKLKKKLLLLL